MRMSVTEAKERSIRPGRRGPRSIRGLVLALAVGTLGSAWATAHACTPAPRLVAESGAAQLGSTDPRLPDGGLYLAGDGWTTGADEAGMVSRREFEFTSEPGPFGLRRGDSPERVRAVLGRIAGVPRLSGRDIDGRYVMAAGACLPGWPGEEFEFFVHFDAERGLTTIGVRVNNV